MVAAIEGFYCGHYIVAVLTIAGAYLSRVDLQTRSNL